MLVYLGGPIDLVSGRDRHQWRSRMKDELASRQISCFDPAGAFKYVNHNGVSKQLIEINKKAMLACDMAIFVMSPHKASIGTPIELYIAKEHNLPHVVIWDPSIQSFGDTNGPKKSSVSLPAYVEGLAHKTVRRFDDAISEIVAKRDNKEKVYIPNIDASKLRADIGHGMIMPSRPAGY